MFIFSKIGLLQKVQSRGARRLRPPHFSRQRGDAASRAQLFASQPTPERKKEVKFWCVFEQWVD
jgi:hypothetical protein